jgi:hypothetical protein
MSEIEFDVSQGPWRVTGSYASEDNIAIYRDGEHFRTFTYPAYKIWNIPAHLADLIESLETGLAQEQADVKDGE